MRKYKIIDASSYFWAVEEYARTVKEKDSNFRAVMKPFNYYVYITFNYDWCGNMLFWADYILWFNGKYKNAGTRGRGFSTVRGFVEWMVVNNIIARKNVVW